MSVEILDLYNDASKVKKILIKSVSEYIQEVCKFKKNYKNPIFFRAQKACYDLIPSSLRGEYTIENEDTFYYQALRKCPELFLKCHNHFEQVLLMQHYAEFSRLLDVTESPLVALYFACDSRGKFRSNGNDDSSSSVILTFQAPDKNTDDYIKEYSSQTVSIISATSKCSRTFTYWDILKEYKNDGFVNMLPEFVNFRDIMSRSVIVRAKFENPRLRNQKGAFILCNANEIINIGNDKTSSTLKYFTDFVLDEKNVHKYINFANLKEGEFYIPNIANNWKSLDTFSFTFKKIDPHSISNIHSIFKNDPFNLERLKYKENGRWIVFLVEGKDKAKIKEDLKKLGYTFDFMYPEDDTILNQIKENI